MEVDVNAADLQAIGDVADWLAEKSDGLPTEKAIEMLVAARAAERKLQNAISLLQSQALKTIEQPIIYNGSVWAKRRLFKRRPNQTQIAAQVVAKAWRDTNTGEIFDPERSAERAVRLMKDLYVSPSTVPKVGGVENLGLAMDDVCRSEHTGFELRETVLDPSD